VLQVSSGRVQYHHPYLLGRTVGARGSEPDPGVRGDRDARAVRRTRAAAVRRRDAPTHHALKYARNEGRRRKPRMRYVWRQTGDERPESFETERVGDRE
jgi:hypothetical protein